MCDSGDSFNLVTIRTVHYVASDNVKFDSFAMAPGTPVGCSATVAGVMRRSGL